MGIGRETLRLLGEMRAAVAEILDEVTRQLTEAWVAAWDKLASVFEDAIVALIEAAGGEWPSRRQIEQSSAMRRALSLAGEVLTALVDLVRTLAGAGVRRAARLGVDGQGRIIASQLPPAMRQAVAGQRFSDRALDAIVRRARGQITSLTRPLSDEATQAMKRELVRGVDIGANPREAARRMVRRVEGEFNGGLTRALVIARTEMIDAHRVAAAGGQAQHADVLDGWTWLAKLDDRSCPACLAMHGTTHPLDEPGPLGHQQCRCSRAPRTKSWRDLGFDIDEPADQIPDAEDWFRSLPRAQQARIMGPARLALLDQSAISWADLARRRDNPDWRPSYVPTPVRDLTPA